MNADRARIEREATRLARFDDGRSVRASRVSCVPSAVPTRTSPDAGARSVSPAPTVIPALRDRLWDPTRTAASSPPPVPITVSSRARRLLSTLPVPTRGPCPRLSSPGAERERGSGCCAERQLQASSHDPSSARARAQGLLDRSHEPLPVRGQPRRRVDAEAFHRAAKQVGVVLSLHSGASIRSMSSTREGSALMRLWSSRRPRTSRL